LTYLGLIVISASKLISMLITEKSANEVMKSNVVRESGENKINFKENFPHFLRFGSTSY
jgi:hypothetical protein